MFFVFLPTRLPLIEPAGVNHDRTIVEHDLAESTSRRFDPDRLCLLAGWLSGYTALPALRYCGKDQAKRGNFAWLYFVVVALGLTPSGLAVATCLEPCL